MTPIADDDSVAQHARTIRALSAPGAPLSPDSRHATVSNPAWFFAPDRPTSMRRRLHREITQPYRDRLADEVEHGRRAIVLAGPPGAGKSHLLAEVIGKEGSAQRRAWLEVDPDEIKKDLLDAAVADGSYESFIKPPAVHELEEQGERFYPLDFAALVHEESSALAKSIRGEAIRAGANVVIDSVLSKPEAAVALGRQLKAAGYSVEVLDVEVPVEVSTARVAERWRGSYVDAVVGKNQYGGRWVPESYVRSVFAEDGSRAVSQESAHRLALECDAVTRYRRFFTPSISAERVLEADLGRAASGGLIDRRAAEVSRRAQASRPPTGPRRGPERGGLAR